MPIDHGIDDEARSRWGLRLAAGAFGGLAGGLAFGVLMAIPAIWTTSFFAGTGMLTLVGKLFGLEGSGGFHLLWVWIIHAAASIAFGLAFALAIPPTVRHRTGVALGLGWGFALWLFAAFLGLRQLTGTPLVFDGAAMLNLAGHLLYGATLGLVYPAFDREELAVSHGGGRYESVAPERVRGERRV